MGVVCGPTGQLLVMHPLAPMWVGPPDTSYLRAACFQCHCTDIAPDDPEPTAPERPECVVDVGEDEVVGPVESHPPSPQCSAGPVENRLHDRHQCNELVYGNPGYADCKDAYHELEILTDAWYEANHVRVDENRDTIFMGVRHGQFIPHGQYELGQIVQLPVTRSNGVHSVFSLAQIFKHSC